MILIDAKEEDFELIYEIMDNSFPNTEMRNKEGQKKLFKNNKYHIVMDENKYGFIAYWDIEDIIFAEHFAVSEKVRGGGYGKRMLESFLEDIKRPIILEVEPPESELTKRRISFYERLGFKFNSFLYTQPSMRENEPAISLKIMSYPKHIKEDEFEKYKKAVYEEVYGINE